MTDISEECSVVAFYGIKLGEGAMQALYRHVLDWCEGCGRSADVASISGPGFGKKRGTFKRADSKLKKAGFEGVTGFELVSTFAGDGVPSFDNMIEVLFSIQMGYFVVEARYSIVSLYTDTLLTFITGAIDIIEPAYGIGYKREDRLGPSLYALGLSQGLGSGIDNDYLEGLNISRWTNARGLRIWERGILRDVYPWNFLTSPQLSRPVDGQPLEDWIARAPGRGRLSRIGGSMVLWEVDEVDLRNVRWALWRAGSIFNWPTHLEGFKNHPYAAAAQEQWLKLSPDFSEA